MVVANKSGKCRECQGQFRVGDEIDFIKGARKDGSEAYFPIHAFHNSPPAAASTGQGGAKPGPSSMGPAPVALPSQATNESPEFAGRVFIQIGGWVPSDRVNEVTEAFVRARRQP